MIEEVTTKQPSLEVAPMLTFFVPGDPKGRAHTRPQAVYRGRGPAREFTGRVVSIPQGTDAHARWFSMVAETARRVMAEAGFAKIEEGAIRLQATFFLPRPKAYSWKEPHRDHYCCTGLDRNNLMKALEDCLTGVLWRDDTQVVSSAEHKRYPRRGESTGAQVTVTALGEWSDEIWPGR